MVGSDEVRNAEAGSDAGVDVAADDDLLASRPVLGYELVDCLEVAGGDLSLLAQLNVKIGISTPRLHITAHFDY